MYIRKISSAERDLVAGLACKLWPTHGMVELQNEFELTLQSGRDAVFVAEIGSCPVGFAHCSLRSDYVEGTQSSPVGYLEGVFVEEEFRLQGVASDLVSACENWARNEGCTEFASDCDLENELSRRFHAGVGFREANRIVCFAKKL